MAESPKKRQGFAPGGSAGAATGLVSENRKKPRQLFQKGKSPNPGGRPKGYPEFRELCRGHTPKAVKKLVEAMDNPSNCVAAAKVLLEFGWGKATQHIEGDFNLDGMTDEQLQARFLALTGGKP